MNLLTQLHRSLSGARNVAAAALAALASLGAARAEIKDAAPGGFTLENSIQVPTDVTTAWKALVEDVDQWWPADHTWWGAESQLSIEPRAGGCFCERRGQQQVLDAKVSLLTAQEDTLTGAFRVLAVIGRLSASDLGLNVPSYDPEQHYREVRGRW